MVFITLPYHINCNLTFYHYVQNELLLRQTFYILPKRNYAFPAIHVHIHYIIYVTSNYIILETFQTKKSFRNRNHYIDRTKYTLKDKKYFGSIDINFHSFSGVQLSLEIAFVLTFDILGM